MAYLISVFGVIPSPAALVKWSNRTFGEPFPCQGGQCACSSAKECWTTCQCQTLEEKLAWAAREGVPPPATVGVDTVRIFPRLFPTTDTGDDAADGCALCHTVGTPASPDDTRGTKRPSSLPTLNALGCKGLVAFLMIVALPAPSSTLFSIDLPLAPETDSWRRESTVAAPTRSLEPTMPPPRSN